MWKLEYAFSRRFKVNIEQKGKLGNFIYYQVAKIFDHVIHAL